MFELDTIDAAISDIAAGKVIIVVDDADRENEGDFVMAASKITAESVNFMAREGRGLICVPVSVDVSDSLALKLMVDNNTDRLRTNFTVSVDLKEGTTTGISMFDRARTIKAIADKVSVPSDFSKPGHVFPLISADNGVLDRPGHTEAAVDLARLAGLSPVGVICEIIKDDGAMARLPDLYKFSKKHKLKLVSIADLIAYRRKYVV